MKKKYYVAEEIIDIIAEWTDPSDSSARAWNDPEGCLSSISELVRSVEETPEASE